MKLVSRLRQGTQSSLLRKELCAAKTYPGTAHRHSPPVARSITDHSSARTYVPRTLETVMVFSSIAERARRNCARVAGAQHPGPQARRRFTSSALRPIFSCRRQPLQSPHRQRFHRLMTKIRQDSRRRPPACHPRRRHRKPLRQSSWLFAQAPPTRFS